MRYEVKEIQVKGDSLGGRINGLVEARVSRFDSVGEFIRHAQDKVPSIKAGKARYGDGYGGSYDNDWDLGVGSVEACKRSLSGDPSIAAKAVSTLKGLEEFNRTERQVWEGSVCGPRFSVSEYLGGNPFHMRRKAKRDIDTRHVNIYVSALSSGGIAASNLLNRGIAILGLLEALQASGVSVDLYMYITCSADGTGYSYNSRKKADATLVVQVDSRPLDVSSAGFVIAHPAFGRVLGYTFLKDFGNFDGGWSNIETYYDSRDEDSNVGYLKDLLELEDGDVVIPSPRYADGDIFSNPVKWIEKRLAQLRSA